LQDPARYGGRNHRPGYKLSILDVVKCALISLPDHLFFVLVFWYYHSEKSFKCAVSIEICVSSVFPGPDPG
jgi:hypothetical protein